MWLEGFPCRNRVNSQIKTQIAHLFQICQGFIFFFKEVHLYSCQIHTPTGFLHCYRGKGGVGGETQGLGEYNIVQTSWLGTAAAPWRPDRVRAGLC